MSSPALVVGGVDVRDFDEPAAVREALDEVPFLVSARGSRLGDHRARGRRPAGRSRGREERHLHQLGRPPASLRPGPLGDVPHGPRRARAPHRGDSTSTWASRPGRPLRGSQPPHGVGRRPAGAFSRRCRRRGSRLPPVRAQVASGLPQAHDRRRSSPGWRPVAGRFGPPPRPPGLGRDARRRGYRPRRRT